MPACLTHYYFAKNVLQTLSNRDEIDECAYFWGAQGPDFLFCQNFIPWRKDKKIGAYGSRLHETKPSATLNAMRELVKNSGDTVVYSYVLGFICHYSLDCTAHPYINYLASQLVEIRENETDSTMHTEIEAALDTIVLRSEEGKLPSEISLGTMFPKNERVQRKVAELYSYVIAQVYGEKTEAGELFKVTDDAHFIFSVLTDRTGIKKKIVEIFENGKAHAVSSHFVPLTERDDVDYANFQQSEWLAGGEKSTCSFFDLTAEAAVLAKTLIEHFDSCDFSEATGEKPFG